MKSYFISAVLFLACITAFAQDMIVRRDGSIIQSKVLEIGTSEVKYKKWSNPDGPSYSIAKSDILAINYQNGGKDKFEDEGSPTTQEKSSSQGPILVERAIADNNSELISKYNKSLKFKETPQKIGKPCSAIGVFVFSDMSVLSNEDIEIEFAISKSTSPATGAGGFPIYFKNGEHLVYRYSIKVRNKTDKILYFDLANCTRTNNKMGESYSFFTDESVSVSKGSSSGVGIGIGGLFGNVGLGISGGTQTSVTKSYSQNRIVSIPPHGASIIRDFKLLQIKSGHIEIISRGEELYFGYKNGDAWSGGSWGGTQSQEHGMPWGIVSENEILEYSYENSPLVLDYVFTYSDVLDFSTYTMVKSNLFLKELIGFKNMDGGWLNVKYNSTPNVSRFDGYDENTILGPIIIRKP